MYKITYRRDGEILQSRRNLGNLGDISAISARCRKSRRHLAEIQKFTITMARSRRGEISSICIPLMFDSILHLGITNLIDSFGSLVSDKVIVVSAGWILRVLTFLLTFSAATAKDNHYDQEWHSCRRCTALVTRKLERFLRIDREWSPFVTLLFRKVPPFGPEVKWST